jgi:hypothetical protein
MLYTLERACTMQVRALAGGAALHQPSAQSLETTRKQGESLMVPGALDQLGWPALLRLLDRKCPDFRH